MSSGVARSCRMTSYSMLNLKGCGLPSRPSLPASNSTAVCARKSGQWLFGDRDFASFVRAYLLVDEHVRNSLHDAHRLKILLALQRLARSAARQVVLADDHMVVEVVEHLVGQGEVGLERGDALDGELGRADQAHEDAEPRELLLLLRLGHVLVELGVGVRLLADGAHKMGDGAVDHGKLGVRRVAVLGKGHPIISTSGRNKSVSAKENHTVNGIVRGYVAGLHAVRLVVRRAQLHGLMRFRAIGVLHRNRAVVRVLAFQYDLLPEF